MKCVQNRSTKVIERVPDGVAHNRVTSGSYTYVAKELWKRDVRDVNVKSKNKEAQNAKN